MSNRDSTPRRSTRRSTSIFARRTPTNEAELSMAALVKQEEEADEHEVSQHVNSSTNASTASHSRRANQSYVQPSSFFLREKSVSIPAHLSNSLSDPHNNNNTQNILRGTQKIFHDRPYNSVGMNSNSLLSSDPDDSRGASYNYEAEEQLAAELEARQSSNTAAKKKARISQEDMPYQPDDNLEGSSDISDLGARKPRRKAKSSFPNMRNGRDDHIIWNTGRPRKRKPKKVDANGNEIADSSFADTTMDSVDSHSSDGSQSPAERHTEFDPPADDGLSLDERTNLYLREQAELKANSGMVPLIKRLCLGLLTLLFSAPLNLLKHARGFGLKKLLAWLLLPLFLIFVASSFRSSSPSGLASVPAAAAGLSWSSVPSSFQKAIYDYVAEQVDKIIDIKLRNGDVISRNTAAKMVTDQLEGLKVTLTDAFNENIGGIQNDILAKVRTQQEMYEKAGSWRPKGSKPKPSNGDASSAPGLDYASVIKIVDDAIEHYSADMIDKRDFALYSVGAAIMPTLTSYDPKLKQKGTRSWLPFGRKSRDVKAVIRSRPPVLAIHPDTTPGSCWTFEGQRGTLGIALSKAALIDEITLDHTSRSISFDDSASAPKEFNVWGLVQTDEQAKGIQEHRRRQAQDETIFEPIPPPPSPRHLFLGNFEYDISPGSKPVQTFPVSYEARALQYPIQVVQFEFVSNHGSEDYTCVYRVRVHGHAA